MDNVKREDQDGKANNPENEEKPSEAEANADQQTIFEQIPGSSPAIRKIISYKVKWKENKKEEKKITLKDRLRGKKKRSKGTTSPAREDSAGITDDGTSTYDDSTYESMELKVKKGPTNKKDRRKGEKKSSGSDQAMQTYSRIGDADPVTRKSEHAMACEAMRFIKKTQFLETALTPEQNAMIRKYFEDDSKKPSTEAIDSLIGAFNLCCIRLQQIQIGDPPVDHDVRVFCKDKETAKVKLLDVMLENMNEFQPQCWKTQERSVKAPAPAHTPAQASPLTATTSKAVMGATAHTATCPPSHTVPGLPAYQRAPAPHGMPTVYTVPVAQNPSKDRQPQQTVQPVQPTLQPTPVPSPQTPPPPQAAQPVQQPHGSAPSPSQPAISQPQKPVRTTPYLPMTRIYAHLPKHHNKKQQNVTVVPNPYPHNPGSKEAAKEKEAKKPP